ncbi:unnamed protein product [Rodentolepis nana]|uniref:Rho-GAP domain-containing protein n=1 Tax=Rodentolepis nana TaxID=102285 RepID=A0A0R3TNK1_RODNA|nr:unnamed protein product [Rodentolepis nana]
MSIVANSGRVCDLTFEHTNLPCDDDIRQERGRFQEELATKTSLIDILLVIRCSFSIQIADHSDENRMTVDNLASVFAPNILRQADYDPDVEMSVTPVITLTIAGFIRRHTELFRYELTHFAQLCSATAVPNRSQSTVSSCSAAAAAVSFRALSGNGSTERVDPPYPLSSMQSLKPARQNFSEPPPEVAPASLLPSSSLHFSRYKSGSLTDSSTSHSQGAIFFPHESRRSITLCRQPTITGTSPSRRLNGRTASADREISSRDSRAQKTGSSSPVIGSGSGGSGGSGVFATPDTSTENLAEQLRHWRSVALVARAEAVCERAKSRALTAELARARCDLNMAETELGLLRKQLSVLQSTLISSRTPITGSSAAAATTVTREFR